MHETRPDPEIPSEGKRNVPLKRNWWYVSLGIIPVYGANNSLQQFGEPWSGLAAGVIVAGILLGITKGIQFLIRKTKGKQADNGS